MKKEKFEESVKEKMASSLEADEVISMVLSDALLCGDDKEKFYDQRFQLLEDSDFNIWYFKANVSTQRDQMRIAYSKYVKDKDNEERTMWLGKFHQRKKKIQDCWANERFTTIYGKPLSIDEKNDLIHEVALACCRYYDYPKLFINTKYIDLDNQITLLKLKDYCEANGKISNIVIKKSVIVGEDFIFNNSSQLTDAIKDFVSFYNDRYTIGNIDTLIKQRDAYNQADNKCLNRLIRELVHIFVNFNILDTDPKAVSETSPYDRQNLDDHFWPIINVKATPIMLLMFDLGYLKDINRFISHSGNIDKKYNPTELNHRIKEALKAKTLYKYDIEDLKLFNHWLFRNNTN